MTTTHLSLPAEAPETYEELVRLYPPRKIHDQVELENATEVADWIALRAKNDAQLRKAFLQLTMAEILVF